MGVRLPQGKDSLAASVQFLDWTSDFRLRPVKAGLGKRDEKGGGLDPGGITDISRWLSEATPPVRPPKEFGIPAGMPEKFRPPGRHARSTRV